MNNKEWIKQVLARKGDGRVPFNASMTPPARDLLERHFGGSPLEVTLDFPIRMNGTTTIKPLYADPRQYGALAPDEFGVMWETSPIDRGSPRGICLPEPSLEGYVFPDPTKAYRYEALGAWCESNRECFTVVWIGDLWERATFMRGMENILLDLAYHPEFVEELLDNLTEYILTTLKIVDARFPFDGAAISDDYGTQRSLIMSPAMWRAFIKPRLARIYADIKKRGKFVFHHSCGHVTPIIPDLIEIGLDILHPIQPETMDVFALKKEFGKDLSFSGGIRTQDLLPCGTPAEIRSEIQRLKKEMGKGGGYILEPGITLQGDVPEENLVALIEEARLG